MRKPSYREKLYYLPQNPVIEESVDSSNSSFNDVETYTRKIPELENSVLNKQINRIINASLSPTYFINGVNKKIEGIIENFKCTVLFTNAAEWLASQTHKIRNKISKAVSSSLDNSSNLTETVQIDTID